MLKGTKLRSDVIGTVSPEETLTHPSRITNTPDVTVKMPLHVTNSPALSLESDGKVKML